jgi:hypothetical protein
MYAQPRLGLTSIVIASLGQSATDNSQSRVWQAVRLAGDESAADEPPAAAALHSSPPLALKQFLNLYPSALQCGRQSAPHGRPNPVNRRPFCARRPNQNPPEMKVNSPNFAPIDFGFPRESQSQNRCAARKTSGILHHKVGPLPAAQKSKLSGTPLTPAP